LSRWGKWDSTVVLLHLMTSGRNEQARVEEVAAYSQHPLQDTRAPTNTRPTEGRLNGQLLQASSSQKHMWPLVLPSVMQTWSTMNRLMSRLSVHVRRTDSEAVPASLTNLTQHPSQGFWTGMSDTWCVQLKGSRHLGSSQLLHSKQSILCPDMHSITAAEAAIRARSERRRGRMPAGIHTLV